MTRSRSLVPLFFVSGTMTLGHGSIYTLLADLRDRFGFSCTRSYSGKTEPDEGGPVVKTPEEELIEVYVAAFNRHDVDDVLACFHDDAVLVDTQGTRVEGLEAVRRRYEENFALIPDGHCDLQMATGHDGRGVAETVFHGTIRDGGPVKAVGTEVMQFVDGKIAAIRDYHQLAT